MNDSLLIKEAIKSLGRYSPNHVKVFFMLIDCAVDNKVFLPVKEIQDKTGMKRSSIYFALNTFQKEGILIKDKTEMGAFVFQKDKIDFMVSLYKKKSNL
jgi:Fe2+ or Zn2+ uptake regulation protein